MLEIGTTLKGVSALVRRPRRRGARQTEPDCSRNAFKPNAGSWYRPALGGASSFASQCQGANVVRRAMEVLSRLEQDAYSEYLLGYYEAGLRLFDGSWQYADINTFCLGGSNILKPASYLEIGVRRGRSAAMVVSQSPKCNVVGFDLWIQNYAGMDNPGPQFVSAELRKVGHQGEATFVAGDSRRTVPEFFQKNPDMYFDMITVDGDHSISGAREDLNNVLWRLKVGGMLIFDDTANHSHPGLSGVWSEVVASSASFSTYNFSEVGFGVAMAIRLD